MGYCVAMMKTKTDFTGYTVTVSTDPSFYGECTDEEAAVFAARLETLITQQFPGIAVNRTSASGIIQKPTGPEQDICDEINDWIEANWLRALDDQAPCAADITSTIKDLKRQHSNDWLGFYGKLKALVAGLNALTEDDISDDVTAADFVKAGFTKDEADAMVFVMTEECMGQPVNSVELIERWFCYSAPRS